MKGHHKVAIWQTLKYFLIIVIGITGFFLGKILWDLPNNVAWWSVGIGGLIILVALIFDALSLKDMLPIFMR